MNTRSTRTRPPDPWSVLKELHCTIYVVCEICLHYKIFLGQEEDLGFERPKDYKPSYDKLELGAVDMERYRPDNYQVERPRGDDINDLMEYYSKYKTNRYAKAQKGKHFHFIKYFVVAAQNKNNTVSQCKYYRNAMGRVSAINQQQQYGGDFDDPEYDDGGEERLPRKKFSDPDLGYQEEFEPVVQRRQQEEEMTNPFSSLRSSAREPEPRFQRSNFDYCDSLDPATRLILMKNTERGGARLSQNMENQVVCLI